MASLRNIVKYTALTEYSIFGGLLAVCAVKGVVQGVWNGHSFMDSLFQGALLPIWLPCLIVCVHLVFVVTLPVIIRLLSTMLIMPFVIYFVIFVTFPTCGHVAPTDFVNLPEAQQDQIILNEAEKSYQEYLRNPNSNDASGVRIWQGYYEKPYTVHIEELRLKAQEAAKK